MQNRIHQTLLTLVLIAPLAILEGCGGGGGGGLFEGNTTGGTDGDTNNPIDSAASILVSSDKTFVTTDNSDTATIEAVVKDSKNRPLKDVPVEFTSSLEKGDLRVLSSTTDDLGAIKATFKSGTNYSNGLGVITAQVTGTDLSSSVPIVLTGSQLVSDITETTLQEGQSKEVTYTATNGRGEPAINAPICFSFDPSYLQIKDSDGKDLSSTTECGHVIYTDLEHGRATIMVQAIRQGDTTLRAESLGVTTTTALTITPGSMSIIQPRAGTTHRNDVPLEVQVNVPSYSGNIRFATSAGTWSNGHSTIEVPVSGGVASATLLAGMPQARIDITATKLDGSNSNVETNIYAYDPTELNNDNTRIKLEISPTALPAGSDARADLKATVLKNIGSDNYVAAPPGSLVSFQISEGTGGGEYITIPVDDTDYAGIALSQLIAGPAASAANGVKVRACVVGTDRCAEESLTITKQPGSIVMGVSTSPNSTADDTAYELPISVALADVNGNLVANQPINLSVWPVQFATGCRKKDDPDTMGDPTDCPDDDQVKGLKFVFSANEDLNMNVTRDASEPPTDGRTDCGSGDGCPLLPPNSAAGTLPPRVTTDSNGLATFKLTYLKEQASFLRVRVTARTSVQGSEVQSSKEFELPFLRSDGMNLPVSPYNQYFLE